LTTLITSGGERLTTSGPYQLTSGGRRSLATNSRPSSLLGGDGFGAGFVHLIGGDVRTVSFDKLYRSQPWIAAGVNKRYRPIIRLPLKVYRLNSQGDKERVREHRLVDAISRPWKRASAAKLKAAMFAPTNVHGNSVLAKERKSAGAPPHGFRPLDWRRLLPIFDSAGRLEAWETREYGEREFFAPEDVLHLRWWSPDGQAGMSPLQQLGVTSRLEDAAQRYATAHMKNSARPPGAIVIPEGQNVAQDDKDKMRAAVRAIHEGPDNAGRIAFLTNGADWKPLAFNAREAELIDQRKVNREEIAAVLDMPPPLMGILDKATYSNIETQYGSLYTDVLGPDIVMAEQEFKAQVIDEEPAYQGLFVEFDLAGVLRGDKLKEIQSLREAIGTGVMTPNEARATLNFPQREPDDDEHPANQLYLPANNLQPLGSEPWGPPTEDPRPDPPEPEPDPKPPPPPPAD
jgi:HK97 family phage portal protein